MGFDLEVTGTASCCYCKSVEDFEDMFALCDKCEMGNFNFSTMKEIITQAYNKEYIWKDEEGYEGFTDDYSKKTYMAGIKHGYESALFWIADYFGDEGIHFIEELMWSNEKKIISLSERENKNDE
jgi:hypothetical protein